MFKSGWIRLWLVLTGLLLLGTVVASSFYVWVPDIRYRFVTVSIADIADVQDRHPAESIKQEVMTKTFTGDFETSPLLTLEGLAKRHAVTQVAFEWLEPSGWSSRAHEEIDLLNNSDIQRSEIIARTSNHVHRARLRRALLFVPLAVAVSIAALALGIGVAWIRMGFTSRQLTATRPNR
jgi:hypothetical protein